MTSEDTVIEAPVEPTPEIEDKEPDDSTIEEGETKQDTEPEPKEETPEEKIKRLEGLESEHKAAQRKISAQRKAYASLQKAALEKDAKLKEYQSQQQVTENSQAPVKPKLDDFDSYEEYEKATSDYADEFASYKAKQQVEEERAKLLQAEAAQAQEQALKERGRIYEGQKKEFVEANPTYVQSEAEYQDFVRSAMETTDPMVQDAVVSQAYREDGVSVPQLIHYFGANHGENMGELEAISKLKPTEAAVEIYKIQQKLKASPKSSAQNERLPKPPKKAKGGSGGGKDLHKGDVLKNLGLKN